MLKLKSRLALAAYAMIAICVLLAGIHELSALSPEAAGFGGLSIAAVVTLYGTGGRDPASLLAINAINAAAEVRVINSLVTVGAADSIGSKYLIGEVPADALIDPNGGITCTAITSAADCDVGFYYPNGGALILVDALVNGQTLASATTVTLAAATGSGVAVPSTMKKRAWELAGLTSNPGGNLAIWLTLNAAATAAGTVWFRLPYYKGA